MIKGAMERVDGGLVQINFTAGLERTIICSVRAADVTICAWCDVKKDLTARLKERGVVVSHGICGYHKAQMQHAAKLQRGHDMQEFVEIDVK